MPVHEILVQKQVGAKPERVWSVLGNYSRDREWRQGVEMRQEPPGIAVEGAITYEELRFLGRTLSVVARLEEVEPGRRLVFQTVESDVPVRGERRVEPLTAHESLVTLQLVLMPSGLSALFAGPMAALLRRRVARDLETLAALVEERQARPASEPGARALPSR